MDVMRFTAITKPNRDFAFEKPKIGDFSEETMVECTSKRVPREFSHH